MVMMVPHHHLHRLCHLHLPQQELHFNKELLRRSYWAINAELWFIHIASNQLRSRPVWIVLRLSAVHTTTCRWPTMRGSVSISRNWFSSFRRWFVSRLRGKDESLLGPGDVSKGSLSVCFWWRSKWNKTLKGFQFHMRTADDSQFRFLFLF